MLYSYLGHYKMERTQQEVETRRRGAQTYKPRGIPRNLGVDFETHWAWTLA